MEVWLYMWRTMRYAEIPIFFHIGNFHVCQFGKNASWGIFVGCLRLLNYRQRCKFIHEAAISFISGGLCRKQQFNSLFTRPPHLALPSCLTLPYFAIYCLIAISCLILPYFALLCPVLHYLLAFLPYLALLCHTLPHFATSYLLAFLPYLALICHILPYLAISYLTLPYLAFLPHLSLLGSILVLCSNCSGSFYELHQIVSVQIERSTLILPYLLSDSLQAASCQFRNEGEEEGSGLH